ncbi:MAG: hypothetical protein M3423_00955, partial [Actinomycetota bacterium]|nr:hypothetical protein [Actinomycetota bacterium]
MNHIAAAAGNDNASPDATTTELPAPSAQPPVAAQIPSKRTHHGRTFVDNYEWLRDKDSPDTIRYLDAENDYTASQTSHLAGLRDEIFAEIKTRTQETDLSVP